MQARAAARWWDLLAEDRVDLVQMRLEQEGLGRLAAGPVPRGHALGRGVALLPHRRRARAREANYRMGGVGPGSSIVGPICMVVQSSAFQ